MYQLIYVFTPSSANFIMDVWREVGLVIKVVLYFFSDFLSRF